MFTKQISVFLENTTGALYAMTKVLGSAGVDLVAMSIADSDSFGVLRCVVKTPQLPVALTALRENGYTARVSDVICVRVPDRPGGLSTVLGALDEAYIAIEYLYSFVRDTGVDALLIFKFTEPERARDVLDKRGVKIMRQEQVDSL